MIDPDLLAFLEQRFASIDERFRESAQQIAELRKETNQRIERVEGRIEQVDETGRQTRVLVEGLRSDINLIVEGFTAQNERMDRIEGQVARLPEQLKEWFAPYFKNLDRRVRALEPRIEHPKGDVL